jgi:hypothetical protein
VSDSDTRQIAVIKEASAGYWSESDDVIAEDGALRLTTTGRESDQTNYWFV